MGQTKVAVHSQSEWGEDPLAFHGDVVVLRLLLLLPVRREEEEDDDDNDRGGLPWVGKDSTPKRYLS